MPKSKITIHLLLIPLRTEGKHAEAQKSSEASLELIRINGKKLLN